jgi:hypothetical protein
MVCRYIMSEVEFGTVQYVPDVRAEVCDYEKRTE